MLRKINCATCENALVDSTKNNSSYSGLAAYKDREDGRQLFLTKSAFAVVQTAEKVLGQQSNLRELPINDLLNDLRMYFSERKYFPETQACPSNIHAANHKLGLITDLANRYIGL
jgi:hypothetical protein